MLKFVVASPGFRPVYIRLRSISDLHHWDIDRNLPAFAVIPIRFLSITVARLRRIFTGLPFHNRNLC